MTLHCQKTGRNWPCATEGQARTMSRTLGLTDWIWCPVGIAPATIRETTAEMRSRARHHATTIGE